MLGVRKGLLGYFATWRADQLCVQPPSLQGLVKPLSGDELRWGATSPARSLNRQQLPFITALLRHHTVPSAPSQRPWCQCRTSTFTRTWMLWESLIAGCLDEHTCCFLYFTCVHTSRVYVFASQHRGRKLSEAEGIIYPNKKISLYFKLCVKTFSFCSTCCI